MTFTIHGDVRAYLDAVSSHLVDLPASERDELLEDLEAHLIEVVAETDEPLAARLGPPADYATELRASAGLPAVGSPARKTRQAERLRRQWGRLTTHPTVRRIAAFLPELRPGWWVLRGVLVVWVLAMTSHVQAEDIPFPPLFGSRFVGTMAMIAAVPLSVHLARRQAQDWRVNRIVRFAEGALLLLTIPLIGTINSDSEVYVNYGYEIPYEGSLVNADGYPISNFYATDADGQPIEHFRLYDQNGMPVTNVVEVDTEHPEGWVHSQIAIDRDGRPVPNAFPRSVWLERYDGSMASVPPPFTQSTTTVPPTTAPSDAPADDVPATESPETVPSDTPTTLPE